MKSRPLKIAVRTDRENRRALRANEIKGAGEGNRTLVTVHLHVLGNERGTGWFTDL